MSIWETEVPLSESAVRGSGEWVCIMLGLREAGV